MTLRGVATGSGVLAGRCVTAGSWVAAGSSVTTDCRSHATALSSTTASIAAPKMPPLTLQPTTRPTRLSVVTSSGAGRRSPSRQRHMGTFAGYPRSSRASGSPRLCSPHQDTTQPTCNSFPSACESEGRMGPRCFDREVRPYVCFVHLRPGASANHQHPHGMCRSTIH